MPAYGSGPYGAGPYGIGAGGASLGTGVGPFFSFEMDLSAALLGYFQIGVDAIGLGEIGGPYGVGAWTTLQARLMAFSCERGQEDELAGLNAGTLTAVLDDDDGAMDPDNSLSAYYPNVKLGRQCRIIAEYNGVQYGLSSGFADEYSSDPLTLGANVQVRASDLFSRLSRRNLNGQAFPSQTASQRVTAILDLIQYPAGRRNIEASTLTVPPVTFTTDTFALGHIADVALADASTFFIDGAGNAVYQFRHSRLTSTSVGSFGAGGTQVRSVSLEYNDRGLLNQVTAARTGGVAQTANDTNSQVQYDIRSYVLAQNVADLFPSDTWAGAWADWIIMLRSTPVQHVTEIVIDPTVKPDILWPLAFQAEVGDRLTISHNVPGTKGVTGRDYNIIHVRHEWSPESDPEYLCTVGLAVAQPSSAWMVIGSGQVGVGQVAY